MLSLRLISALNGNISFPRFCHSLGNDEARDNNRTCGRNRPPFNFDERAPYSYWQKRPEGLGSNQSLLKESPRRLTGYP